MIILSQDKTEIINFDNVNTLRVTKGGLIMSYRAKGDYSNILGKYKTEERAKEVLNEIIDYMTNKSNFVINQNEISLNTKSEIYYMPQE